MPRDARNLPSSGSASSPFIPMAERIHNPVGPTGPLPPAPQPPTPGPATPLTDPFAGRSLFPFPWSQPWRLCYISLKSGCYRVTFTPNSSLYVYHGTMRVDSAGGGTTISGDLYRFVRLPWTWQPGHLPPFPRLPLRGDPGVARIPIAAESDDRSGGIPIYPRNRYYSYLKVIGIESGPLITTGPCELKLVIEEYVYSHPAPGSFDGSFPSVPSRTFTVALSPQSAPPGFAGDYYAGKLIESGVEKGSFTMEWVSEHFRKATLEVDTVDGAVPPEGVPAASGEGTEDFRTIFETAGWDLNVIYDQTSIPVPDNVNATSCWSHADLHALMLSVRNPATNLDQEWRLHLVVVPATMGCDRGVMYDTIDVPREGVASFSDDGYPRSNSLYFGSAEGQRQRDVPRAFLRSAAHEVGHGFNQQHQNFTAYGEPGTDNSIMTPTPGVADVLRGPSSGAPGVFPDDIALRVNDHVRHHMIHLPDPVVRPGGMTFGAGHWSVVPEADEDRYFFGSEELELRLSPKTNRVKLGEPLPITWELVNNNEEAIPVPNDIRLKAQHAHITVVDPGGVSRRMPSFVIQTDTVTTKDLQPGEKLVADATLFWSSNGFAFETPGKHDVEVRIMWNHEGIPYGVKASTEIWVDYPVSDADNEIASTLMCRDVGMYVALGGGAAHLEEAVSRIDQVVSKYPEHPACKCLMELDGDSHSRSRKRPRKQR